MTGSPPPDEEPPTPPDTRDEQGSPQSRVEWTRQERLAAWSNAASVINVVCAVAAFALLVQTLSITQDTLAVSQRAAEEARRQADAALAQVDVAQKALASSESATVYFSTLGFMPIPQADGTVKTGIMGKIGNSGGSPTRGLTYSFACKPLSRAVEGDPFDQSALDAAKTYFATLAPNEVKGPVACSYTIAETVVMSLANVSVYVFGRARYQDTVDKKTIHTVEFCQRLSDVSVGSGFFAFTEDCERHNCRDDECAAQP